jgi:hypothetical protein
VLREGTAGRVDVACWRSLSFAAHTTAASSKSGGENLNEARSTRRLAAARCRSRRGRVNATTSAESSRFWIAPSSRIE